MRVKSVMDELFGEKIDIIPYDDDFRNIVKKSLSPAEVDKVEIDEENETATVYVRPSQRAKALGRNGSNINLASRLLGYTISLEESDQPDIVPEETE
jgi:N utilization substance protein A